MDTATRLVERDLGRGLFPLESALTYRATKDAVEFSCVAGSVGAATVLVQAWSEEVIRCRLSLDAVCSEAGLSAVVGQPTGGVLDIKEVAGKVVLRTSKVTVEINLAPWQIIFRDAQGRVLTQEIPNETDLSGALISPPPGFRAEGDLQQPIRRPVAAFETLQLFPGDHFYGFGEKFNRFDNLGQTVTMWQHNAYGARTERSYKNVPFFVTPRGYGLLVDSSSKVRFYLGTLSTRSYTIEVPGSTIEYYLIVGTPEEVLRAYSRLVGRPQLPPRWALGLWVSTSFVPVTQQHVQSRAERLRAEQIPADVMHIDSYWQNSRHWSDLKWNSRAFPDPGRLIEFLHREHFKVCLWENPYVSVHSDLFKEGAMRGYFVRRPDGSVLTARMWGGATASVCAIVDFTNPDAVRWFRDQHEKLLDMGVDAFKTDFGEEIPEEAVFSDGRTGAVMRNAYACLYQQTIYTMLQERYGKAVIWARSGGAGAHRYPCHWSGDPQCTFEDMASTLRGGLCAAMSGFAFWSHDIGGFWGTPTPELYIRWAQFGLLSPISRYHGQTLRDPWEFGEEALRIFRKFAQLRYRLLPYLYGLALEASEEGLPMIRPMVLVFPLDPATYSIDTQYMLGDRLLIAPVLNEDGSVDVYIPGGTWFDYWTDETVSGPRYLRRVYRLEDVPIFVRGGAIIPVGSDRNWIGEELSENPTFEVYLTDQAECRYRDEIREGTLRCVRMGETVVVEASPSLVPLRLRLHACSRPLSVSSEGRVLPELPSWQHVLEHEEGWCVDGVVVGLRSAAPRVVLSLES